MFFQKLKRQYFTWCLFACGIGISHIIENVRAFDPLGLLVNAFMVLALAFLFYCIAYCVCSVLSLMGISLPKFLSLLLITLVLFSVMAVPNTEANVKEVIKRGASGKNSTPTSATGSEQSPLLNLMPCSHSMP